MHFTPLVVPPIELINQVASRVLTRPKNPENPPVG